MKGERFLLDTCIFTHMVIEPDRICQNVADILNDYNNTLCMSVESERELIVSFNNGEIVSTRWKTAKDMIVSITEEYSIQVLPLDENCMKTYSGLELNIAQKHKDPSDHVIISQAITMRIPLISSDSKFDFYRNQGLELVYNG